MAALGKVFPIQCNATLPYQQPVFYCFLFAPAAREAATALGSSATKTVTMELVNNLSMI